jgi:protein-L-isoaspartate(D-aspartate) O-methyltransferase
MGTEREALLERLARRDVASQDVLEALGAVPREKFVSAQHRDVAWADRPLPIGNGQTISAPHMVASMADKLDLESGEEVLEIGTGCGYHAAVTAELVGAEHLVSVEVDQTLAEAARNRLEELGYGDVTVVIRNGREGYPERAPYDAAYLTCAASDFPDSVVDQVRTGGRLLGPLGDGRQTLVLAEKTPDGIDRTRHGGVRFVRMREG